MGFKGYGAGIWSVAGLGDFYNGKVFPNNDLVFLSKADAGRPGRPDQGAERQDHQLADAPVDAAVRADHQHRGLLHRPEMVDVEEETTAAYAMLRFGGDDKTIFNGVTVQGNVGLRFVKTKTTSSGGVAFPTDTWYTSAMPRRATAPLGPNSVTNISCWLTPDGASLQQRRRRGQRLHGKYDNWLPSFNVRFGLTTRASSASPPRGPCRVRTSACCATSSASRPRP
jgi:hypothetical protein